ncbi:MAG: Sapep family Mn(2+)-dependent dipeptidase [Clostridia bacterium]|nr:Sapep family Mn(2+)-dependent dipeptidase [Clostridia bacterium]
MQKYFENLKTSLKKLISIPSVEGLPEIDKPFGKGVYDALDFTLSLAREMGFETKNYDNYIGEVIFGEGEEEMAILCHLDVVPVGKLSDWKYPPFSATEVSGKIYGRGATDDKGPAVVCLYCLKALLDEGFKPRKKIKLILGCNEESGWRCIKHYKKVAKMPDFGFSPDADFPVIYAEKGILHVKFAFPKKEKLSALSGGTAINVVCDACEAVAPYNEDFAKIYGVTEKNGKLFTVGKTAHGSTPDKGVNAILPMIKYLESVDAIDEKIREYLFDDILGLKLLSDETGNLTMSPDMIGIENDKVVISVDFRYPATLSGDDILEKIKYIAPYTVLSHQKPLYNDKESFLIKTLLGIYNECTGKDAKPIAIGGGTYARALKLGVAFGPEGEGEESTVHQPNEYITIENLKLQFEIYKKAIKKLAE